ncbi:32510_t:CDS:2, partial [Racocetra persica]
MKNIKIEEVCDTVRSQKGGTKLNIKEYLMVKEKNRRDDSGKHNHLPDASHSEVVKAVTEIKKRASESREKP